MEIRKITGNKKNHIDLLLLADESEGMIDKYLEHGEMFVLDQYSVCRNWRLPLGSSFYHNCGFTESHRAKNFFIDNYDHPMFEDGIQLVDMVYLKRER